MQKNMPAAFFKYALCSTYAPSSSRAATLTFEFAVLIFSSATSNYFP